MYLQTAAPSVSNIHLQSMQTYHGQNPVPVASKLDAITEQIANTQDAALKALERIEDGSAKRMWEAQKSIPSATWIGDLMDRLFGWGKYNNEDRESGLEQKRYSLFSFCPNKMYPNEDLIRGYLNTSYEVQSYPNQSCSLQEPTPYWTVMWQRIYRRVDAEDPICRIADCIVKRWAACYPHCWPCQNATDSEVQNALNTTYKTFSFDSDFDHDLEWVYFVHTGYYTPNRSNLSQWKLIQIHKIFNDTRQSCENQILHPPVDRSSNALYSLLAIPVVIAGVVFVVLYKRKPKNTDYEPL